MALIKKCIVPICCNTSLLNPKKLYIMVPINVEIRKKWYEAIFGSLKEVKKTKHLYVCEDHFNDDAENFHEYKTIGKLLRMKKEVVPHKNLNELIETQDSQLTSSSKKRKSQNIEAYKSKKKLTFSEAGPSTPIKISKSFQMTSPSGSFEVEVIEQQQIPGITLIRNKTKAVEDSPSSIASSSSFIPLSTSSSDDIATELIANHMKKLNLKVTTYNIEHNSRLFLGLPQDEYLLIKITEKKCFIKYVDIMITFLKIRCNDSYARIAISFGISESNVSKICSTSLQIIAAEYQNFIFFPSDMETLINIPSQFLPTYKHVRCIIDCLEIQIETPTNARLQAITWSSYKKSNTIKYLVSSTPHGFVNFISFGYGGRTSDREIMERSNYLEVLPRNCTILADRGFKSVENLLHRNNSTLVRPPSVSTDKKMSRTEVMASRRIAACRIHIERVIRRLREFALLEPHSTVNIKLVPLLDNIVIIACALINVQGALIK